METLIIITVILGVIHFLYESIILPSIISNLEFKIDKLRDKAIMTLILDKEKTNPREFNYMMASLEICHRDLGEMKIFNLLKTFSKIKKIKSSINIDDTELNFSIVSEIKNEDFVKMHKKSAKYMLIALFSNSFMLIFYLLPILIPIFLIAPLFVNLKNRIMRAIVNLSFSGGREFEKMPISNNGYCLHQ